MTSADPPYEVTLTKTHSTVTIRPSLTDASWAEIEEAGADILNQLNGHKPKALLIDLTPLDYIGSSLVAMIVRCWKGLAAKQQRFVVVSNSVVVCEVLHLSGLGKMWTIVPTPEAGLKRLGVTPGGGPAVTWTIVLGVMALLTAGAGIGAWLTQPDARELATGLILGGAGLGFVLGLTLMLITRSRRRFIGLGLVLLSVGAGVFRLLQ